MPVTSQPTQGSDATVKLWRMNHLDKLELLRASHLKQVFPKHTHERYAVGVIERGALGFFYRGENVVAAAGDINLCIPGEMHTGGPLAEDGWTYRMFYIDPAVLSRIASEMAGAPRELPFIQAGTICDDRLACKLVHVHQVLEHHHAQGETRTSLEQETQLVTVLGELIARYADAPPRHQVLGAEPNAVKQVKNYLEQHYADDVALADLANLTQLSRYHLLRVFAASTGVPPHAYLRQVRLRRAKDLLSAGCSIAEVAVSTGFNDQSHLTRWLKRVWGVTPGQYQQG
ncbi:MAG: AraC family transcriptional regulator [Deinococcota bacterium]